MASTKKFLNHPGAKEAPAHALEFQPEADHNPPMRGLPLVAASMLISNSQWLQRFMWSNAKFGQAKYMLELNGEQWRAQPNVIPISSSSSISTQPILPLDPSLTTPQPPTVPGRFNSIADYHAAYASGQLTPLQVIDALLPLIRRDIKPKQQQSKYAVAFIQSKVDEVLAEAKASTERWQAGRPLGILDGVPFGVKDDTEVEGYVSTMGMKVDERFEYFKKPATETVWPAKKLREAGAIMVGKMNQHEIGMDTTGCNPATGTATNWYNTQYFPGGSSSGAGSALSAGLVPIAIGTDAGGSMRIPPAFCGVYGLKPTHNRVVSRNSSMCVVGPMCSNPSDLTIAYRIMAQPNPSDPAQSSLAPSIPPSPTAKKYLGLCPEWIALADADVRTTFNRAIETLCSSSSLGGYELVTIKLPYLREGQLAHAATCLTEAAADARNRVANPDDYLKPLNYPNRIMVSMGAQTPAADYLRYNQLRHVIMQHLAHLYEQYPGLLIVTPTTPMAGWPIMPGDNVYGCSDGNRSIRNMTYVWVANTSGCPAVTCPGGYVEAQQGEGKLPVGVMAMAEWGEEERLLGFAREMERYLAEAYEGGRQRPKEWVDILGVAKGQVKV
ncbi:hypothetical protein GE21DRAFT_1795 [Neurospora crassa]|uniref:N-acylethanolamine amidohydrolase n=2 Tax=Neurospora crassa TaxID=5141 RepID=Q7SCV1_NEUCR|nr:N-acylethanolamine amidohydrolase [Neurospora crassa OR74A]EAA34586.1 N-acylethanolamine amidohydrolase [Neurospora crassa OR74A]KHE82230.1 hypothetical protein GE21DRAFT_1795 [Neurospora crassa]CAE81993.1 related to amidase [Neurospora crassa]|eukprot:XP_963822.1 N-acylethanolamine amidohydrolase [Neurospora crassa OR74A]